MKGKSGIWEIVVKSKLEFVAVEMGKLCLLPPDHLPYQCHHPYPIPARLFPSPRIHRHLYGGGGDAVMPTGDDGGVGGEALLPHLGRRPQQGLCLVVGPQRC